MGYMSQSMINTLDSFFATKVINDVDRSTFLICNLDDKQRKIVISLVFMKDADNIDPDGYSSVIIENTGAVFIFPCYWVSIPKPLAMKYFTYIIESFYENEISKWSLDGSSGNTGGNNNGCGCPCGM